ncbi:hypothetical protein RintRC_7436 [Richelia intracellularis]|nr:hypothetical protein RintRC_7436 [Richelia intracellularis]
MGKEITILPAAMRRVSSKPFHKSLLTSCRLNPPPINQRIIGKDITHIQDIHGVIMRVNFFPNHTLVKDKPVIPSNQRRELISMGAITKIILIIKAVITIGITLSFSLVVNIPQLIPVRQLAIANAFQTRQYWLEIYLPTKNKCRFA